jgi:hypothetical protein
MNETEWLTSTDPQAMLSFLQRSGMASDRKLRLFGVGCCHHIWDLLADQRSRQAVDVAEAFAEGLAGKEDLGVARVAARAAARLVAGGNYPSSYQRKIAQRAAEAAAGLTSKRVSKVVCSIAGAVAEAAAGKAGLLGAPSSGYAHARAAKMQSESGSQRALLVEFLGALPFRPVPVDPAWLTWNDGIVKRLAEVAYQERALPAGHLDPARLAVLADALTDAGCTNADLLDHLRGPGPHVRGCWAIDLLAAQEGVTP